MDSTAVVTLYEANVSVARKFYHKGGVPLNFSCKWYRKIAEGKSTEFKFTGAVKLVSARFLELNTLFYADASGSALIGVGCRRPFAVICNGKICCTTLKEGKLYDLTAPENHSFLIPVRKGENQLRIRIAPGARGELFCCRVLEKSALKLPVLAYDPVLSHPGAGRMSVLVRTVGSVGAGIEFRRKGTQEWSLQWDEQGGLIRRRSLHKFFLKDLEPGAEYQYRIRMIDPRDPDVHKRSRIYSFTSAPPENCGNFSFVFTADTQFEPALQRSLVKGVLESCEAGNCDFLVLGGDVNSRYSTAAVENDLLPVLQAYTKSSKALVMLHGNHELRGPEPDSFIEHWSDEDGRCFYMFRFGDTAFLVLDAWENRPAEHPRGKYYSRYNLDQLLVERECRFVAETVNSDAWKSARRRIVLAHGAPFSQYDSAGTMYAWLGKMTDPFFKGKKPLSQVDLWLAGHTHIYTRSVPGSEEIAAFAEPPAPNVPGSDYSFPVFSGCGPNRRGQPLLSGFRVECFEDGSLKVRSFLPDGKCFEEIRITAENQVQEILSLPRFTPEKRS